MRKLYKFSILGVLLVASQTGFALKGSGNDSGGCLSEVSAVFSENNRTVTAFSTKDLSNVVLEFDDYVHQKFEDLSGYEGTFSGTGDNLNKCIIGVWIKSGCNASGDGPGYGERVDNPDWNGSCNSGAPSTTDPVNEHVSTVTEAGSGFDDKGDIGSLRTAGSPIAEINAFLAGPNPVGANSTIYFSGAASDNFLLSICMIDGRQVARNVRVSDRAFDLASLNLKPGLYLFLMQNGSQYSSQKILIQ